ncbi:MAG TPA: entericidin A/B family lipoprotein [Phycisphaeraceae bacterium]
MLTRLILLVLVVSLGLLAIGCNTFEGMGEDLSAIGRAITDAAQ